MIMAVTTRHRTPAQPTAAALQSRLRASGLRSTASRLAVLRFLESAPRPVSHADLVKAFRDKGIDRVTLYRNLTDLTRVCLVRRTDLGDHVWRFESTRSEPGHAGHPHFTCLECGTVSCLPEASVRITQDKKIPHAARRALEILIRGICDHCS